MEIKYIKGDKGKGDHKFYIKTDNADWECVTISKVALLLNQLAVNELIINGDAIKKTNKFFFESAVLEAILMARRGIVWADQKNNKEVFKWSINWLLKPESIESQLRRAYQAKLNLKNNENGKP